MGIKTTTIYTCDRCKAQPDYIGRSATIDLKNRVITIPGSTGREDFWLCEDCNSAFHHWMGKR